MTSNDLSAYPILRSPINWGSVEARFVWQQDYPIELVSNVNIVPIVGDQYVIIRLMNGRYELPGGTLEPNETILDGLKREVIEEVGSELIDYRVVGYFHCISHTEKPYRPHIPHPQFVRLFGYGEVQINGEPTNPLDGEQIATVELVSIHTAIERFESGGRYDIANLYRLAHDVRNR